MYNLSMAYNDNEDFKGAYEISDKADKLAKELWGNEYPIRLEISDACLSYQVKYNKQKRLKDLIEKYEYAKMHYGPKHPDMVDVLYNLSNLYLQQRYENISRGLLNRAMKLELEIANNSPKY